MFNLVYASTARKLFSDRELLGWLPPFREKNARLGITGLLLYKHGAFMQALEGEEEVVRALFATICQDERHHGSLTLVAMPVPARQFPDWSMGFEDLGNPDLAAVPGYKPLSQVPPLNAEISWQGAIALNLIATFVRGN